MPAVIRTSSMLVLLGTAVAVGSVSPTLRHGVEEPRPPLRQDAVPTSVPAYIEVNRGQAPEDVEYVARTSGYDACIAPQAAAFTADRGRSQVRMRLLAARSAARSHAPRLPNGRSHYLHGSDRARWLRHVPHVEDVLVEEIYACIDVRWRRGPSGSRIAYQFELAPGADPGDIAMEFDGATRVGVTTRGDLLVTTESGEFRHSRPIVYEVVNGARRRIAGEFHERGGTVVGFRIGPHDPSASVVIDPEVSYATYFGGSDHDVPTDITVDADGAAIVVGRGLSTNMPTTGSAFQTSHGGGYRDGFVVKLSASGSSVAFATYVGGNDEDELDAVVVDGDGDIYVAGESYSTDFPTESPLQSSLDGAADVVVAKLTSDGSDLDWSTYYGGSGIDKGRGIYRDGDGAIYVTGWTDSTNFPSSNAFQSTHAGGIRDGFAFKLNAAGSVTIYSSYLGGSGDDYCHGIAVDGSGAATVCGFTKSTDFPTASALYSSHGGGTIDAFVAKVAAAGTSLTYSTYLGGSGTDIAWDVDVDDDGDAYVTGYTTSTDYPTASPLQSSNAGGRDAFVSKLNSAGSTLVYSTYLGGSNDDGGRGIDVTPGGIACFGGIARSSNFPTESAVQSSYGGGTTDGFVAMLNAAGSELLYSTFIGGSGQEFDPSAFLFAGSVVLDASGVAYATGRTESNDFPTQNPAQSVRGGAVDAFIVKIPPPLPPSGPTGLAVTLLSDRSVRLVWVDEDTTEAGFEVERALGAESFVLVTTVEADVESFEDVGLVGSSTYRWRVRSKNEFGSSGWSNVVTAGTPSPPPSTVSATSPSNRSVTLTWSDDSDDETGYIVERALGCPGVTWSVIAMLPPNSTSYTDNTVQPEATYSYRVRTQGTEADSTPSLEVCVITGPANPTSLLAITQSDSGVLLRWGDNSAIESSYEIERTATGGAAEIAATVPANTAEHSDDTVAAETEYTYRVRARTPDATSSWSPKATTRTAPAAPTEPFGEAVSSSRLRVSWTDNSSVEKGFEVRRRIHGDDGTYVLVDRVPANATSLVDVGLLQETSYDYTVNAYDSAGDSNPIAIDDLETTAVLVIRSVKLKAAKKKKPAQMTVKAEIDFGGYQPGAADGVTIGVNGTANAIAEVTEKNGKKLSGKAEGVSFALVRKSPTASRGKLKITVTGPAAEVEDGVELTISFTTGAFTAAGTIELASGRFDLKKRMGLRVDPDVVPTSLKLKLGGIESDVLKLAATFESRTVPDEQPNALITVGDSRLVFDGESATVKDGRVTYRLEGVPDATLTIDYVNGTLKLTAKKHELGDYEKGDIPTLLDVVIGTLRWRDVPVLNSRGGSATY